MTDTLCKLCGVPHLALVVCRIDGSNRWALDTDLCLEYPDTWGAPQRANVGKSGVCIRCAMMKAAEKR